MRRSCSACGSLRRRSIAWAPAPDHRLVRRHAHADECPPRHERLQDAGSGIAQQFGFARMPLCSSARSPFTSGTTRGTPRLEPVGRRLVDRDRAAADCVRHERA